MTRLNAGWLAAFAALSIASAAFAHPQLKMAGPAPGSVLKTSPKALRIEFSEGLVLGFSGIDVTNEKGEKQETGDASLNPKDSKQLIVPMKTELAPGKYTVAWHAVGDDTHHVQGKYSFEVKP
jgi:methionine-rich copper-binding protein CopC